MIIKIIGYKDNTVYDIRELPYKKTSRGNLNACTSFHIDDILMTCDKLEIEKVVQPVQTEEK